MQRYRRKGLEYSAALHVLILLFMIFGLPSFLKIEPPIEPAAITVELLPITGITNVKPVDAPPAEQPKAAAKQDDKPQADSQKEAKKPSPPVKSEQAPPPPAKDAVVEPKKDEKAELKKEEKKPDPTPDPKKDEKKDEKKKAKEEDLDAILKAVKETAQKEKKSTSTDTEKTKDSGSPSKAISNKYDDSLPMSLSEKDAIMGQIARCWSPPAGAKDAHNLIVVVNAEFNMDGSFLSAEIANESKARYNSDSFYRAAAESALRAVRQCSPLKGLPADKYGTWKSMELHFDPREMLM